jgi:cold shock CspA family protein
MDGYKTLTEGTMVSYELHKTDKGLQARKVLQLSTI